MASFSSIPQSGGGERAPGEWVLHQLFGTHGPLASSCSTTAMLYRQ